MEAQDLREAQLERWLRQAVGAGDEAPSFTAIGERFRCGGSGARRLLERIQARGVIEIRREPRRLPRIIWKGDYRG